MLQVHQAKCRSSFSHFVVNASSASDFIQADVERYIEFHRASSLINKVHFPQWDIYYTFKKCKEDVGIDGITKAQEKKHEAAITKMLKVWLQPLKALTNKRLIGRDDFVYKRLALKEFKRLPKITAGEEGAELQIIFQAHALELDDWAVPCRGYYTSQDLKVSLIKTDEDVSVLLHELGHAFGLHDTYAPWGRTGDFVTHGVQPASVMSSNGFDDTLTLGDDDINGMHWLYRYFQRTISKLV